MNKILLLLFCIALITGCKKSTAPKQPAEEYLESGTWRVTNLVVEGVDKSDLLNGYTLTFQTTGTVQAVKGPSSENGTWSVSTSGSGQSSYTQLKINFPAGGVCVNLKQDWDLYGVMPTEIYCHKNFSGNGEIYTLWLLKN
jgi:hypothetical protein